MCQRQHAPRVGLVVHQDERRRVVGAPAVGARTLVLIGEDVHPSTLVETCPHRLLVGCPKWGHARHHRLSGSVIGDDRVRVGEEGRSQLQGRPQTRTECGGTIGPGGKWANGDPIRKDPRIRRAGTTTHARDRQQAVQVRPERATPPERAPLHPAPPRCPLPHPDAAACTSSPVAPPPPHVC